MAKAFVANRQFGEQITETRQYQDGIAKIAGTVASSVRDQAPVKSGHYKRNIKVYTDGQQAGVAAHDIAAHLIEFGSAKNPAYAPMRRGVRAAGLRLEQSPKQ